MPIDTGTFIAGVGVLVTLDLAVLTISVSNARKVGTDRQARRMARRALKEARADGGEVGDAE
jgi:hypothetical protein